MGRKKRKSGAKEVHEKKKEYKSRKHGASRRAVALGDAGTEKDSAGARDALFEASARARTNGDRIQSEETIARGVRDTPHSDGVSRPRSRRRELRRRTHELGKHKGHRDKAQS